MATSPHSKILTKANGTYALTMEVIKRQHVSIGKLGATWIKPGFYIYLGSAFGPGGLRARLSHHSKISGSPHWHIDYLRPATEVREIWYTTDPITREHRWALTLIGHRYASIPVPGFGASDCDCRTHLIFFRKRPSGRYFRKMIRRRYPNHGPIKIHTLSIRHADPLS